MILFTWIPLHISFNRKLSVFTWMLWKPDLLTMNPIVCSICWVNYTYNLLCENSEDGTFFLAISIFFITFNIFPGCLKTFNPTLTTSTFWTKWDPCPNLIIPEQPSKLMFFFSGQLAIKSLHLVAKGFFKVPKIY